jgi:hypothetical protein
MSKDRDTVQRRGRSARLHSFLFILPLLLALACLCAACGSNGGAAPSGSTPSAPPRASTPATPANPGRISACPNPTPSSPAAPKPNVVIKINNSHQTVVAHNGDLIEVLLPSNEQWSGPTTSQGILVPQNPSGYPIRAEKMCVWRFVARGTGATTLTFSGRAICKAGEMCPMYIIEVPFTIEVK